MDERERDCRKRSYHCKRAYDVQQGTHWNFTHRCHRHKLRTSHLDRHSSEMTATRYPKQNSVSQDSLSNSKVVASKRKPKRKHSVVSEWFRVCTRSIRVVQSMHSTAAICPALQRPEHCANVGELDWTIDAPRLSQCFRSSAASFTSVWPHNTRSTDLIQYLPCGSRQAHQAH